MTIAIFVIQKTLHPSISVTSWYVGYFGSWGCHTMWMLAIVGTVLDEDAALLAGCDGGIRVSGSDVQS